MHKKMNVFMLYTHPMTRVSLVIKMSTGLKQEQVKLNGVIHYLFVKMGLRPDSLLWSENKAQLQPPHLK